MSVFRLFELNLLYKEITFVMIKRLIIVLVLMLAVNTVNAQGCSVCTKTAAGLGSNGAKGLNAGIIYLAGLPLVLMGTIGVVWYRRNRKS